MLSLNQIHGLLSTAFDDLSSLSEDEEEYNEFKKFANNCDNNYVINDNKNDESNDWSKVLNGLTSTPRISSKSIVKRNHNLWTKTNGHQFNVSAINEEEEDCGGDGDDEDEDRVIAQIGFNKTNGYNNCSKNSSLENGRTEQIIDSIQSKQVFSCNERSFSQNHVQLLIEENQRLSNELIVLQQQLSAVNGNYDGLQFKLKELDKINSEKENELVRLEGKIRSLEMHIKVEREAKEEVQRKLSVSDSTIESLQYQLREIGKSDCMVRARETHDSVINNVKQKHENEIVLLKGEIEGLKYELNSKNNEINSLNKQIDKLKSENHENSYTERLKEMVQITKDLWEKEMKDKVQNDIKTIVESAEKTWSKNSELELINAKRNWETELQTEIVQIIALLKSKAKISTESLPSNVSLRFVPLLNLWHALENACDSKEQALITQSNKLKEAQKQLEEALAESRLNFSVNPPISASNDALMSELKVELQNVKEEAIQMKHKLNKYKQHYHQLVKKHKNEIERIKSEFASILEAFKQNLK